MQFIPKFLLLTTALSLFAGDETRFRVNVDMVQVRVAVTDSAGRYVRGLATKDFRVLENGVEQKISMLTAPSAPETAPTSVFVLFDTSNRMYRTFVYAEDAIADFIHQLAPSDRVAVYSFSRNVTRLARLTRDHVAALIGLRHAVSGDQTALYDSMLVTLRDAARVEGNRVLVVFSNGPDNASQLDPDEIRSVAEDEGITVYVVSTEINNRLSSSAFREMAQNTGGKTFFAREWQEQKLAFEAIDEDLNNSYVLGYYPQYPPHTDTFGYRKIDVKIPGDAAHTYRIRARSGYSAVQP